MKDSIIILCGGGPAPGMNTVVFSVAKTFLSNGYRVIGLHEGYTGLFNDHPRTEDIDFFKADAYFQENNVKLLVTVGGDDTASTANRIAKFLEAKQYPIHNIHVPKTIDDDLPLPNNAPTFGFNSAKDEGAHLARTIYEDARTSGNWLLISAMGRSAGHLALGIGEATHCPMTIIPEMFNKTKITVDKIIKLTLSAIIKRKLLGIHYGTVVVAEGVFHDLDSDDLKGTGVHMTYDEHGHPELGKISKAVLFNDILEKEFSKLGWKVKTRPVEIGYDVRCQDPIAYDLSYCTELAMGVYELFKEGKTGCMVYIDEDGNPKPLFLKDIQNAEGKIPPRRVDIEGGLARNYYEHLCHYITPADYEAAKEWVSNPEEYDFKKILNW